MALLRDGRRCSGRAVARFWFQAGAERCTFAVSLVHADADGTLEPFFVVEECPAGVAELRQLVGDLDGLTTGAHRVVFYETLEAGLSMQVEADDGGGLTVEVWVDLLRANAATRVLGTRGQPQAGLRFRTTVGDLQRFWAELQDELDRMYS